MIEMTLHSVTVRCEDLTQALALLDSWARMGRIELPPAPTVRLDDVTDLATAARNVVSTLEALGGAGVKPHSTRGLRRRRRLDVAGVKLPSVPAPSGPPKRKAPGTATELRPCGVCDVKFECPVASRLVTCKDHRLKPGENLETARKKYQAAMAKNPCPRPPKRIPDLPAAKGLLGRAPIKPNEATKACSACGDKARVSDLDKVGRCRDCHPVGDPS